jgi:predicted ester cyclase
VSEGPQGIREQFDAFHAAFDGFRAQILRQVAEGDLVVTHKVFRGTHSGEIMGVAPTGREVEIAVIDIVRLEDGRIVEHWNVVDLYRLMAQLSGSNLAP